MRNLIWPILIISLILSCCQQSYAAYSDEMFEAMQQNLKQLQESVRSLQATVQSQNAMLQEQAIQIENLQKDRGSFIQPQVLNAPLSSTPAVGPNLAGLSQGFNPDIGVTGTVQTKLTESDQDGEGNDTIALKELELNFAQVVDPFSRLDAIISFNDNLEQQNVDIEEAYYTRWELPLGFTTQLGKFRSKIGKQNLQHLHALNTADYPLVIRDFFGEEGLAASGARLQNMIPNPFDVPLEITGEVLRGNNGPSFSGISRRPVFNTHLKTFFEPTKDTNLELGWTTLFGDENPPLLEENPDDGSVTAIPRPDGNDRYGVKIFGGDATFNWFLPQGKQLKLQNELYFQNRTNLAHVNDDPWGFYSLLDFRFSPKYSVGVRFDYLEPLDVIGAHNFSSGIAPYFVFWQSEFADFKLQYEHLEPAGDGISDNQIYLQVDFLIGAHKHPVQ